MIFHILEVSRLLQRWFPCCSAQNDKIESSSLFSIAVATRTTAAATTTAPPVDVATVSIVAAMDVGSTTLFSRKRVILWLLL